MEESPLPAVRTALVVDDSAVECMLATVVLQKLGFSVTCVASAEQALQHISERPVDLAICDISLPGMDGLALLAALARAPQAPACVVLSAHGDPLHEEAALHAGARAYLVKPLRMASMRAALEGAFLSIREEAMGDRRQFNQP
nr:response regulator [uncultured Noviherbaspirillum sp.]